MKKIISKHTLVLIGLLTLIILSNYEAQAQSEFVVIANADVPLESIDKNMLKRVYNGFTTQWKNSTKIKPCYIQIKNDAFWKYIGTTNANFQKFWTKRVFSGNGVSPVEHKSSEDLIKYVNEIPGAIGILSTEDQKLIGANSKVLTLAN
ncbi:MAG: hypothetical protein ABJO02_12755 [Reichenbachiella sp.]|uniref:hypothetical protein n=1 Tax=Reichenbachiella sp. TaxID=2184521 RepID=UPI003299865D